MRSIGKIEPQLICFKVEYLPQKDAESRRLKQRDFVKKVTVRFAIAICTLTIGATALYG
jgi:hypothetical protein